MPKVQFRQRQARELQAGLVMIPRGVFKPADTMTGPVLLGPTDGGRRRWAVSAPRLMPR